MGRGEWETGVPVVILGGVASRLFLSVQDVSSSRDAPLRSQPRKHREGRRGPGTGGGKVESILKYINPGF